jgi:ABC-type sugar transport system ATPase subunit
VAIDPRRRVRSLSLGEKQLVEIARALQEEAQVVILDEPNSALAEAESARLFGLLRRLRDRGTTVLYVSHRLEEVFAIADRITVLRDGRRQGTWRAAETSVPQVIAAMIGRRLEETFPRRAASPAGSPVLLEARGLERGGRFGPVTFALHEGEILGLAGLAGSGVEDVFRILFGLEAPGGGEVRVAGGPDLLRSPRQALRGGLALIPPNRRDEGLFMRWPIRKNATIAILERFRNRLGLLGRRAERRAAEELIARLRIVTEGTEKRVSSLSGGNQQKVVLAKWLAAGPRVLLLHDPTRGVDVGAKQEIYRLCDELARRGLGIVFSSSELEETIGLSDRILVFWEGRIVRELRRGEAGKAEVLHLVTGGAAAPVGP